jgi:hypothetical protein
MGGHQVRRGVWLVVLAALLGGVLTTAGPPSAGAGSPAPEAHGSVNQVHVTDALANQAVALMQGATEVDTGTTDTEGSFVFRAVPAGGGYTVEQGPAESEPVTVTDPGDVPPQSLYDEQTITATPLELTFSGGAPNVTDSGTFGYIETRDGTTLSALASLPWGAEEGDGPFPVLVEYSGYAPSNPDPGTPSPTQLAANLSGYAWVGVNVRGTACSGGAFDYFETLQRLDGYDVIEVVAAQDWVDPQGVGMVGISYPGNAQLFVSDELAPHLSAMAPLSVVADTYRSTLYPGGILNSGFATEWASDRDSAALPAAEAYAATRIANGDTECEDNQKLRLQRVEIVPQLDPAAFYEVERGDSLAPWTFVGDVDIPVFLAGTFQDEQTGGHWPTMIDDFASADPLRVVMTNGTHTDPLGPLVAPALMDFFDLYLKREVPSSAISLSAIGPALYQEIYGEEGIQMVPRAWSSSLTYAQALAQYEAEPPITVLWENGSSDGGGTCVGPSPTTVGAPCGPQYPYPSFTSSHTSWPPSETSPWIHYLQPDGRLATGPAPTLGEDEARAVATYAYDPTNGSATSYSGGSSEIWRADATYAWDSPDEATSLSFLTAPATAEQRLLGSASADLWIRATAPDVDLEVTLSEVMSDGNEVYIQSGWLRASHRADAPGATTLQPFHSHLADDAQPLSASEFSLARVEIFPFAHVIRPGSRLRLTVAAPGGNRPFWQFDPVDAPEATQIDLSLSDVHPSRLVLPRISGVNAPDQRPACGSLRAQPCREFEASRAPTDVAGQRASATSMDVSWAAPEAGIGDEGFEIVLSPGGATATAGPGATSATVTGLAAGSYTATVRALDSSGDGPQSSPSASVDITTFLDVPVASTFWADIEWMAAEGITTGFPGELYKPASTVTRQSMSAFMYRLAGSPAFTPDEPTFNDVTESNPFFAEIEWMNAEGITTGFPGGLFKPGQAVTRQSMSAFMYRLAGSPPFVDPPTSSFGDVATSSLFFTEIEWMAEEEITTGFPGGLFKPGQAVTRQAMSAFMHRLADGPGVGL